MTRWLIVLGALSACAAHNGPEVPAPDPHDVAIEVVQAVQACASPDAEDPEADWRRAHVQFEAYLEPELRRRHGDHKVAEVEYRFGLVRARLGSNKAEESARRLGELVASLAADLGA